MGGTAQYLVMISAQCTVCSTHEMGVHYGTVQHLCKGGGVCELLCDDARRDRVEDLAEEGQH